MLFVLEALCPAFHLPNRPSVDPLVPSAKLEKSGILECRPERWERTFPPFPPESLLIIRPSLDASGFNRGVPSGQFRQEEKEQREKPLCRDVRSFKTTLAFPGKGMGEGTKFQSVCHAWVTANFILILDHCMMSNYIPPQSEGKVERRCVPGGIGQMGQSEGLALLFHSGVTLQSLLSDSVPQFPRL